MRSLSIPLVLAVALALPAAATTDPETMKNAKGSIATVDAAAKSLTVKLPGEAGKPAVDLRVMVDAQTKIIKDGHAIQLTELQVGDVVVVNYRPSGGSSIALSIGVQPKEQ